MGLYDRITEFSPASKLHVYLMLMPKSLTCVEDARLLCGVLINNEKLLIACSHLMRELLSFNERTSLINERTSLIANENDPFPTSQ